MIMVPPAGVEPATYRLGGGSSSDIFSVDLIVNFAGISPINGAPRHYAKPLIPNNDDLDFGRHSSVLTERPTDTRQPMDTTALWYALAAGLAVVVGMAIWTWLERKADQGSRQTHTDPPG